MINVNKLERKEKEIRFKKEVIENIRYYRQIKGITQAKLAEDIDVSHEFIRSLESLSGKNYFSAYTLWRIAIALDVTMDSLCK